MAQERIEVVMTSQQLNEMQRTGRYGGRKLVGWTLPSSPSTDYLNDKPMVYLYLETVEPSTSEVITISPTAANEIHLELINMRNQFEESAKKITSLLDKS